MARYWCERCRAESNTMDPPHVCKDIAARLRRREAQVAAVEAILFAHSAAIEEGMTREPAEEIVAKLAHMGVTAD